MRKYLVRLVVALCVLSAIPAYAGQMTITWSDNSNNEDNFELWRSPTGVSGSFAKVASPAKDATAHIDPNLPEGVKHFYFLKACNTAGCSAPSQIASGTTVVTIPAVPTGLTVTPQ